MRPHVVFAVFRRNLTSYFTNPAGYVFICIFVLAFALAAFGPDEFFNANLANFDQLNSYLPYLLLVFIPSITMTIWADERRQGTDELLLTIPAGDFDVVLGKYLAAVAIYTAAILFSTINFIWLARWGDPDWGLLAGNYFGYWMVGLAMLSIGMVASFMTSNLTVGFILGVVFNLPLVFATAVGDLLALRWPAVGLAVKDLSLAEQFRDFGQGVVSLSGVLYFGLLIVVMLYLSMVLIGRRHWWGPQDGPVMWLSLAYTLVTALGAILLGLMFTFTNPDKALAIYFGVALVIYVVGYLALWGLKIVHSLLGHYLVRAVVMGLAAVFLLALIGHLPRLSAARLDVTAERLSSLTSQTRSLIANLKPEQSVQIEAYISPTVPESFVPTRLNLLNALRELESLGGGKIRVRIHATEALSEQAQYAEQQFGITSQQVTHRTRGAMSVDQVFLGVAVTSKLEKVVVPFFDRGVPVEYELVRSIGTVTQQKRKRLAVLSTDAKLYGGFNMQNFSSTPKERIIEELEKQYEVVQVSADSPITVRDDKGELINDVLLAVQPSSLSPEQMPHFIAAVKAGQPTAIFEDPLPFPALYPELVGTTAEKQPPGGMNQMFGGQQPPPPKGDISPLWEDLGVSFAGVERPMDKAQVVWQEYNPYPKFTDIPKEWVFVGKGSGASEPFNAQVQITSQLQELLFLFPGFLRRVESSNLKWEKLVSTGSSTGTVPSDQVFGFRGYNPEYPGLRKKTGTEYALAARIRGTPKADQLMSDEGAEDGTAVAKPKEQELNVVLVADVDVLSSAFFEIRQRGSDPEAEINLGLDNVTFVLNTLDLLAQDDRFIAVRSRRPAHRTLTTIEDLVKDAKEDAMEARLDFNTEFDEAKLEAQAKFDAEIERIERDTSLDEKAKAMAMAIAREVGQQRLQATIEQLQRKRDASIRQAEREQEQRIRRIQSFEKTLAVLVAPILPFFLGLFVWIALVVRETEGVSKARLR